MDQEEYIEGHFVGFLFQGKDHFTIAKFETDEKYSDILTVTGFLFEVNEESPYRLFGSYVEHAKYGMQYKIVRYEKVLPTDDVSLIRYFSSTIFQGIGKKTAGKVVAYLGKDSIQLIQEDPSVLNQIPGLSEKHKTSILEGVARGLDESIVFLTQLGLNAKNIGKIEAVYEDKAAHIIKNNPYQLIQDVDGIGFRTADKIAQTLGFKEDDPMRLKAAMVSIVLESCMRSGHTYCLLSELMTTLLKQFSIEDTSQINLWLHELQQDSLLSIEDEAIYHITQYKAEQGIADFLTGFPFVLEEETTEFQIDASIEKLSMHHNITYDLKQKEAIHNYFDHSFSILTGGPGTGKTTIVRAIIELQKNLQPLSTITLCAPTGRAAKRLGDLSGIDATTIHSLLKWDLDSNRFGRDSQNPIETDILIIDEFSMVDNWLFYNLLLASHNVSKILLIGDEDQLPSVGPGFLIKDLIECDLFKVTRLEKIFRQSEGSDVISLAHDIREGTLQSLETSKDVKFFACTNLQMKQQIVHVVSNAFEKGYTLLDIQVLAPMYQGVAGIDELNKALQLLCNPPLEGKKQLTLGYRTFRLGDKILQLKNQPEDGVFNGDIGMLSDIELASDGQVSQNCIVVNFEGTLVTYTRDAFVNITHAYCVSIHKSQGSEYPIVVMPILKDYAYMLQRRLIYTGITRAKKSLVLLGEYSALEHGIQSNNRHLRRTKLVDRLKTKKPNPFAMY